MMRVSDVGIQFIIAHGSHAIGHELNLALDLRDARREIAELRRQLAEQPTPQDAYKALREGD